MIQYDLANYAKRSMDTLQFEYFIQADASYIDGETHICSLPQNVRVDGNVILHEGGKRYQLTYL